MEKDKPGSSITSRVAITSEQMEELLQFIEQNPALGKGKTKPLNLSQKLWSQCAKKLNAFKNGAKKNGKQWAKTWTDMKYRVRQRALEWQAVEADGKPPPDDLLPLSNTEERILSVIGIDCIKEVVIQLDHSTSDADPPNDTDLTMGDTFQRPQSDDMGHFDKIPRKKPLTSGNGCVRVRKRSLREPIDRGSSSAKKIRVNIDGNGRSDSDSEDSVSAFLDLEKRKIENAEKIADIVCDIRDQLTRLTEVFVDIKDAFLSSFQSTEKKKE